MRLRPDETIFEIRKVIQSVAVVPQKVVGGPRPVELMPGDFIKVELVANKQGKTVPKIRQFFTKLAQHSDDTADHYIRQPKDEPFGDVFAKCSTVDVDKFDEMLELAMTEGLSSNFFCKDERAR
eukprot:gnl/TRDRNA2_/TRDRNA2_162176_c0_seq1.p1 gnl/TRDRNA2_/TRDRNA2_162176_c0~~gnl/TRDRNA2_/TRDRNA2_162176_c0_seq1.p1  ORF type:complete len:124 (+),score=17.21 gnl/TRDRNA2_/TRDRNA2_162176_c0_seq1:145-516(+)